jgi:aminoglycoside phosphotransferase (APT) family kinase protein
MADTQSRRSELLAAFLAAASGAARVEIAAMAPLRGGAIQENWGIEAHFDGGNLAGEQRLVLRAAAQTGVAESLGRIEEFALLQAAFAAGVTVPELLFAVSDPAVFGKPFFVMRHVSGTADPRQITRREGLDPIAEQLGHELARIHRVRPPRPDLGFLPPDRGPMAKIARYRAWLDRHPVPKPVLEWAARWLETHLPAAGETVLCHHDFRTGNYLVDGDRVTAILDWEFAGWGDPMEDIGWFCSKGWRFLRIDREAGGIADRAPFYRGYEAASGRRVDAERARFWEILASLRWAVIALEQSDRYMSGGEQNLDLALTGRRASECELEILMQLDHGHA